MNKYLLNRMNISLLLIVLCACFADNYARMPFQVPKGTLPFAVYFPSRYRGMCMGTMISRVAVLTAAVCICNPTSDTRDRRPINVVGGTDYRHPKRGIKVQVQTILLPKMAAVGAKRGYTIEQSVAVLLLKHEIPDAMAEFPVRGVAVDYLGTEAEPELQEECLTMGWHFFNLGVDKIYEGQKFLLKRYLRVQFLNVVKKHMWCEELVLKFQASLDQIGYVGHFEKDKLYCLRDGMYGAPMICNGHVAGIMTAPDAQWTNCTGCSNIYHKITTSFLKPFLECIAGLFRPEHRVDMNWMKKSVYMGSQTGGVSFESDIYDKVIPHSSSSSD